MENRCNLCDEVLSATEYGECRKCYGSHPNSLKSEL